MQYKNIPVRKYIVDNFVIILYNLIEIIGRRKRNGK